MVEGPSDKAVLSAINDNLENILDNHDITIISCGSKNDVDKYMLLCNKYNIKYVTMIDDDYIFRWNKINDDKERLLRQLNNDKMKDKLKKEGIQLDGFDISNKEDIEIKRNHSELVIINNKEKEIHFKLNINDKSNDKNANVYLRIDNKDIKLAVEKVKDDYYVYREDEKKIEGTYKNIKRCDENTIILNGEVEDELRKLWVDNDRLKDIWNKESNKINETKAYEFIDILMKDKEGKRKIKNSKFYRVSEKVFEKRQKPEALKEVWNKK